MKLKVGETYELNNGEVHECTGCNDGEYLIAGWWYGSTGSLSGYGYSDPRSVKRHVPAATAPTGTMTPPTTWTSGHVNRWHTNDCHALRNSQDSNHQHSARVALLLWHLWPDVPAPVLVAALAHDLPEKVTGDMSGETKRANPEWAASLDDYEDVWLEYNDIPCTPLGGSVKIKLCDKIDAILWAWSVDPALMKRDDWQKQIDSTLNMAYELGVGNEVKEILT